MFLNDKGSTLIQVVIAAGIASGLGLAIAQMAVNMTQMQSLASSSFELMDVTEGIRTLLKIEKSCKVSFAGDGTPVRFRKSNYDNGGNYISPGSNYGITDEGMNVSLWHANFDGSARSGKMYNGADFTEGDDRSQRGKIKIKSLKLVFSNPPAGNFPANSTVVDEPAQVVAFIEVNKAGEYQEVRKVYDILISATTNGSGRSTLDSCSAAGTTPPVVQGCAHPGTWYCSCTSEYSGSHEGYVQGCMHCNAEGQVDDFRLLRVNVSGSNSICPGGVNPPGSDPVQFYRVHNNP